MKFDGTTASASPGTYGSSITNRQGIPSYVDIDVNMVGNASGGTAYISVTAEQELTYTGQLKVWSIICEDHDIIGSGWGAYSPGTEMMWLPVAWSLGTQGNVLNFTGPYPQTISVSGTYTLNPTAHTYSNLNVVTFVQPTAGTKAVLNADFMDLPDTATGIEDQGGIGIGSSDLSIWPNPSSGFMSIGTLLPDGASGTVSIFSIAGRTVDSFDAAPVTPFSVNEPGVYFVVLETSDGSVLTERFTVVD